MKLETAKCHELALIYRTLHFVERDLDSKLLQNPPSRNAALAGDVEEHANRSWCKLWRTAKSFRFPSLVAQVSGNRTFAAVQSVCDASGGAVFVEKDVDLRLRYDGQISFPIYCSRVIGTIEWASEIVLKADLLFQRFFGRSRSHFRIARIGSANYDTRH